MIIQKEQWIGRFFFLIDLFDEVLLLKAEPHQEQQYLVQHFLTKQQK